jgi:hypothetical protein
MHHLCEDFRIHSLTPIEQLLVPRVHLLNVEPPPVQVPVNYASETLNRAIDGENKRICPITYNQIKLGERYMLCSGCLCCYSEYAIIEWFVSLNVGNKELTCPTCRKIWDDYNVYIHCTF